MLPETKFRFQRYITFQYCSCIFLLMLAPNVDKMLPHILTKLTALKSLSKHK